MNKVTLINFTSYILTLVGYMTLKLTLSVASDIAHTLCLSQTKILSLVSLLFMIYSLSAVILASTSDIMGATKILHIAQPVSIIGLIIIIFSQNLMMLYIGFILIGIGTGPYASISRAIVSRNSHTPVHMKKVYSFLSIAIVLGPLFSSFIGHAFGSENWRSAYITMAAIEFVLYVICMKVLVHEQAVQQLIKVNEIIKNFIYIFSTKGYAINLIVLVLIVSFYIQIVMANVYVLLQKTLHINPAIFNVIICLITLFYIFGILSYRKMAHLAHHISYRCIILFLFIIFSILFSTLPFTAFNMSIVLILLSFCTGYIAPLSTGSAMLYIKRGHGSAAAVVSFAITFGVSVWTFIQAHLGWNVYDFMLLGLWVTIIGSVFLTIYMGIGHSGDVSKL